MSDMKRGHFDFDDEAWEGISSGAKDLIRQLIVVDPHHRLSAAEALEHRWLKVRVSAEAHIPLACAPLNSPPVADGAAPPPPVRSKLRRGTNGTRSRSWRKQSW